MIVENPLIISNWNEASFPLDVAYYFGQKTDISDIISHEVFFNTEFCPKFLVDTPDLSRIGRGLEGKTVYLISTSCSQYSRIELATRNFLIASSAKENGAKRVVLVEPDLFFSAQDRGPHFLDHPQMVDALSRKKFDGQPFSSRLYAELLHHSGVDQVVTVHNHKPEVLNYIHASVRNSSAGMHFVNLDISPVVAHFVRTMIDLEEEGRDLAFLAPDKGAQGFLNRVADLVGAPEALRVVLEKTRQGQREVTIQSHEELARLKGRNLFILDDMVRTGSTIRKTIELLSEDPEICPRNIYFYCTHTYISPEGRNNLNSPLLTEFITTNTLPQVLNRDEQGRLRRKMVVLKIEKWIADTLRHCLVEGQDPGTRYTSPELDLGRLYSQDFSSKNVRRVKRNSQQLSFALD